MNAINHDFRPSGASLDEIYAALKGSVGSLPLVIDSFAGGGGASTGIEAALSTLKAQGHLPAEGGEVVDFAINHNPKALAMHEVNHPGTIHLPHNVWKVSLRELVGQRSIGLLWMSPDCRHHSRAKGDAPISDSVRDLASVALRWLKELRPHQMPRILFLENVPEFLDWGPTAVDAQGKRRPVKSRKGEYYRRWAAALQGLGYVLGWRKLAAKDYGTPTLRNRFYLVARRDGLPIVWPEPTHGHPASEAVLSGRLKPWTIAADLIDWSIDCPSIFLTKAGVRRYKAATGRQVRRPLKPATCVRIAKGVMRYVVKPGAAYYVGGDASSAAFMGELYGRSEARPLDAPLSTVTRRGTHALTTATLAGSPAPGIREDAAVAAYVKRDFGQSVGSDMREPVGTVTPGGQGKTGVVAVFLAQNNTGLVGHPVKAPLSTVVGKGCTQSLVAAHLLSLKGSDRRDADLRAPHPTVCAGGQHSALVTMPLAGSEDGVLTLTKAQDVAARRVAAFLRRYGGWTGGDYVVVGDKVIVDLGMRMLSVRELARAQGFPESYVVEAPYGGGVLNDEDQRHMIGNSVCPQVAAALVAANYRPMAVEAPPVDEPLGGLFALAA